MKLQKMTNAVADTEGEIFTTRVGLAPLRDRPQEPADLGRRERRRLTLTVVPIEGTDEKSGEPINNYQLIYNELGVYLGEKLGNPCDDSMERGTARPLPRANPLPQGEPAPAERGPHDENAAL